MYKPNQERLRNFWVTLQDTWLALYGSSVPTAAAINVKAELTSYNNNNVNILILIFRAIHQLVVVYWLLVVNTA